MRGHGRNNTEAQIMGALRSRGWVFVAISILAIAIFLYTNSLIRRLEMQAANLSRSIAGLCATATYPARENEELRGIFTELIESINFPIIITDRRGVPITWKGLPLEVDPYEVTHEEYLAADPADPADTPIGRVMLLARELDKQHSAIPMTQHGDDQAVGYVHYGESSMIREMRFVPAIELVAFGVLVLLGFLGFRNAKVAELRSIWVGLAKETAHQLGTPISSLMGWVELLREAVSKPGSRDKALAMTDEMQRDLQRLEKISFRFNQIGSVPKTKRQDIVVLLREVVDYLRRRTESSAKGLEIVESYQEIPLVDINRELMEWVIENLVRNSVEALPGKDGRIEISSEYLPREGVARIYFTDNGKGMTSSERRQVFVPGYSTKRKGWGLGLALARRIVEEYHEGRLHVSWSEPGKGSTFVISLPVT